MFIFIMQKFTKYDYTTNDKINQEVKYIRKDNKNSVNFVFIGDNLTFFARMI